MRDIFVIAQSQQEFDALCESAQEHWKYELKHKMVHEVQHPSELKTKAPCRVFLVGSYYKRSDWPELNLMISLYKHKALLLK